MKISNRKGIILAGGTGSRLWPITFAVSKQLLPVHDKPMIYYPISVLMLAGIREIAIITTREDRDSFSRLIGDGSQWGVSVSYITQNKPEGIAQAYLLAETFLDGDPSALILGDNIYYGHGFVDTLLKASSRENGATVFGYQVLDPERYGVVAFNNDGEVTSLQEKPEKPKSNYVVTGLYFLDSDAPKLAREVDKSDRGEYEILDLLELYRAADKLSVTRLGRGYAWLDTGTHNSLLSAGNYVKTLQSRQGLLIGSPDEIAYSNTWITKAEFLESVELYKKSEYGKSLARLVVDDN